MHEFGTIDWIDERPVIKGSKGPLYATVSAVKNMLKYCDSLVGRKPMVPIGGTYNGRRVLSPSTWGVNAESEEEIRGGINACYDACVACGIHPSGTAATTSVNVAKGVCRETEFKRQLPDKFRQLTWAAIHPGPTIIRYAYLPEAVAWDRCAAYLESLARDMPVAGSWGEITVRNSDTVLANRELGGIIHAIVYVDPLKEYRLPPLPVSESDDIFSGTAWGTGYMEGAWTVDMLRAAIRMYGACVIEILGGYYYRKEPWLSPAYDTFKGLPDPIRKPLYQRLWGKLASSPMYHGERVRVGGNLTWKWTQADIYMSAHGAFRPDVAAEVCGENTRVMIEEIGLLPPEVRLQAAHVDCIWISKGYTPVIGKWKKKAEGESRFFAPGTYYTGSREGGYRIGGMASGKAGNMTELLNNIETVKRRDGNERTGQGLWCGDPWRNEWAVMERWHEWPEYKTRGVQRIPCYGESDSWDYQDDELWSGYRIKREKPNKDYPNGVLCLSFSGRSVFEARIEPGQATMPGKQNACVKGEYTAETEVKGRVYDPPENNESEGSMVTKKQVMEAMAIAVENIRRNRQPTKAEKRLIGGTAGMMENEGTTGPRVAFLVWYDENMGTASQEERATEEKREDEEREAARKEWAAKNPEKAAEFAAKRAAKEAAEGK